MNRRLVIFAVFAAAHFLSYFFRSANAVIAEDLVLDLSLTAAQLGLMTSLFFAAFALAQLPIGVALDRFGARWVTPALMLLAVLGSLVFAAGQSFGALALGRALMGLGMAGILMGAFKSLAGWFSPARFATASGMLVAIGSSGALAAATPLAWLNAQLGWRSVFLWGALIISLGALAIALWAKGAPPGATAEPAPRGGLAAIFGDGRFWRIALLTLAMGGTLFAYQTLWAGPYLQGAVGLSAIETGNMLLFLSGGVLAGYFLSGWVAGRFGLHRTVAAGALLFIFIQALLALSGPAWPRWLLAGLFTLFGLSGAFGLLLFAHARLVFPRGITGRVVTAVNLFSFGGGALLQWGLGLVIGAFGPTPAGGYPAAAYHSIFAVTAGVGVAALLFYLPLVRQAGQPSPAAEG